MQQEVKKVLSNGYCYGKLKKVDLNHKVEVDNYSLCDIKKAIELSLRQLDNINSINKEVDEYINIQKMILSDKYLIETIAEYMKENKAIDSINLAFNDFTKNLCSSESLYLKQRISDMLDIKDHIIYNLIGRSIIKSKEKVVIYIEELYPSILLHFSSNIIGIICKNGGFSSHTAILCRSQNIPLVVIDSDIEAIDVIIDTRRSIVITNPSCKEISEIKKIIRLENNYEMKAISHPGFKFLANVSSNNDIKRVNAYGFDGVGLYRTELIFINSNKPLSFDEQLRIYSDAIKKIKGKVITFRTFDVGDDKKIDYINTTTKGVNNYINNKELFETQIKALLLANDGNMKLMFPMIRSNEEFKMLKEWVIKIAIRLDVDVPELGMMLETKDAIDNIETFVDVDFISIGTNDLTHELYNVDRNKDSIEYNLYLNDLINRLKRVVDYTEKKHIELSVCGELASINEVALEFYKIGIRELSVSPALIKHLNISYQEFKNH